MRSTLPLLFLAASPLVRGESEWKIVSISVDKDTHYVDVSSIRVKDDQRRAWVRVKYGYEMTAGTKSNRSLVEFDCGDQKNRSLQTEFFKTSNWSDLLLVESEPSSWAYPAPDSSAFTVLEFVCGYPAGRR